MFQFIFTNLLFLSLGVILWLFVRALPRLDKEESARAGIIQRWITSDLPEKFDSSVNSFLVKFFRKVKLLTLKIDNVVGERLKKMKWKDDQESKPDFSEIISPVEKNEAESPTSQTDTSESKDQA